MLIRSRRNHIHRDDRGVAVTELALTLPLLVLIVLGTIEICSMIFLQQTLRICAYEGARVALVPGANINNVRAAIEQLVEDRNINSVSITIDPADFDQREYGSALRVAVTADCGSNGVVAPWFFRSRQLTGEIHMMMER